MLLREQLGMDFGGSGRSERDEGDADEGEDGDADEFAAGDHVADGLSAHPRSVKQARPGGESDEAAMRGWVANGEQQEDAQRDVEGEHHGERRLDADEDEHGIGGGEEEDADHAEDDF